MYWRRIDEFGPGVISAFGDILAKCLEQVERVLRRKISRSQFCAKWNRVARSVGSAEKSVFKSRENCELRRCVEFRIVGCIVGGAGKAVERQYRCAKARRDEARRDGKILVTLRLAGFVFRIDRHCFPVSACTRPFHSPPRPALC